MESEQFVISLGAGRFGRLHPDGLRFFRGAFEVEFEKTFEDLFIRCISRPAVSGGDGFVEFLVR